MTTQHLRRRDRGLEAEVSRSFRVMLAGMLVVVLMTGSAAFWLEHVYVPRARGLDAAVEATDRVHVAMIDAETSLIAYLSARQERFLTPYARATEVMEENLARLDDLDLPAGLTSDATAFRVAQAAWWEGWAAEALGVAHGEPGAEEITAFLAVGKAQLDRYRAAHERFVTALRAERDDLARAGVRSLAVLLALVIGTAVATTVLTVRRRRQLGRKVVDPVLALRRTVDHVAAGDLSPPPRVDAPDEILALRDGLARMTEALAEQQSAAVERQARTDEMAARLREIVTFARTMSGSLSLRHVLDTLGTAVQSTVGARSVRVWLREPPDEQLHLAYDTRSGRDGALRTETCALGQGLVGRSAARGEVAAVPDDESAPTVDRVAVPLIVGARIIGVVEIDCPGCERSADTRTHVDSLVGHAAAAIEAARLFQRSERLSAQDGLTGLANRRRLDEDLARQADLALRHGRRLGFVMLDLDRFKEVNDTYGHQRGDQVLREVAAVLRGEARASDSVYRYGGEELAVLVPEADAVATALLAERLRAAVETHVLVPGGLPQTVSCGVASMPEHATSPEGLVAAADAALYVAKQSGRNRVVVSGAGVAAGVAAVGPR